MSFSIPTLRAFSGKGGPVRNWATYCQYTDNDPTSYGIMVNGYNVLSTGGNSVTGNFTVNFNEDILNLIIDYGATITYNIYANEPDNICDIALITGNASVGMSDINVTYPIGCTAGTDVYIDVTVSGLPSNFFDNVCCPLGYCSRSGSTFYYAYAIITANSP